MTFLFSMCFSSVLLSYFIFLFYSSFLFLDVKIFPSTILMWYSLVSFQFLNFFHFFLLVRHLMIQFFYLFFHLFFMGFEWKWKKVNHQHFADSRSVIFTLLSIRTQRTNRSSVGEQYVMGSLSSHEKQFNATKLNQTRTFPLFSKI